MQKNWKQIAAGLRTQAKLVEPQVRADARAQGLHPFLSRDKQNPYSRDPRSTASWGTGWCHAAAHAIKAQHPEVQLHDFVGPDFDRHAAWGSVRHVGAFIPELKQYLDPVRGLVSPEKLSQELDTDGHGAEIQPHNPERAQNQFYTSRAPNNALTQIIGKHLFPGMKKASLDYNTPEFKSWFQGSKVASPDGQPLRVFHGTSKDRDFSSFKIGKRGAWFTTDPEAAGQYAAQNDSQGYKLGDDMRPVATNTTPRIIPAHLALKNPYRMTPRDLEAHKGATNYNTHQAQHFDQLRAAGHDGVDFGGGTYVAFHPNQIKSVFNNTPTEAPAMHKADDMIQKLGKSERDKNLRQVASIAAFKDGKFLMGLRDDVKLWCLPGGHLEPDESPAKGAVRELLEETGLRAQSLERLGSAIVGKKGNVQVHCYRADVDGTPDASNDPDAEMVEFRWVDPDDIPEEILSNLYNKQDVTLQLLGAQAKTVELSKASLAEIMAKTKASSDHMRALADGGEALIAFPHPAGGHVMVTRDPSKPGAWRATRTDANGEPQGHVEAPDHHAAIKRAHDYGADIFAIKPFQKNIGDWLAKAQKPENFGAILNAVSPEGRRFVDHKTQMNSHPLSIAPAVEHYENNIKGSPQMFKHTPGSRAEGVSRKVVYNSRDQSMEHNVFDHPDRYMVKPYHEGIVSRVKSWQKYPIQGWAEMAHQALYHAGGIGDLHQKVHVSEHDMKSKQKGHAPGEPALVVHMESGMTPAHALGNVYKEYDKKPSHDAMKIGLMDFLTNNLDRHHGNLLMGTENDPEKFGDGRGPPHPDWMQEYGPVSRINKVMAIDHSRSFQYVNNHHHKWDSQAKMKKTRNLEDSIKPYLFGGNTWRPAVSELIPPVAQAARLGKGADAEKARQSFLESHAKPAFDWWAEASPKIKAAFEDQIQHIKDPEARDHIRRNFMERAKHLDERAHIGIENYGTDWYNDPVSQYHPDQKSDEEMKTSWPLDVREQYEEELARDKTKWAEINAKYGVK